ncbi:MAG: ChaN family lipoprotein [Desulfomonile tiedjei]|uniref:ChaN family lipoprotein n=1 Tax=Desulfomonile tiedjei TaxID=2358 RepID=A0A9D6Z5C0_9BACT|nr:ChaN family lipoprotein [Desulfomonile tiedjei]
MVTRLREFIQSNSMILIGGFALSMFSYTCHADDCGAFVVDLLLGEPVPKDVLLDDLSSVRIIYLGEYHTIERHHKLQTDLLRSLAEGGMQLSLGMEMFSYDQQEILDRWLKGKDDIAGLIKDLGAERWTNLKAYEPVLVLARDLKFPIIALNAPEKLVRKVSRGGLESLSESERKSIPESLEQINPQYDRLLRIRLRVHRAFHDKGLKNVVLAQALRDQTMAGRVVSFLQSPDGKDRSMIVIAGSGHLNYGFGIPERVERHNNYKYRILLASESGELVLSEEEKRQSMPVDITHEDLRFIQRPIADYVYVVPLKDEDKSQETETASAHLE